MLKQKRRASLTSMLKKNFSREQVYFKLLLLLFSHIHPKTDGLFLAYYRKCKKMSHLLAVCLYTQWALFRLDELNATFPVLR